MKGFVHMVLSNLVQKCYTHPNIWNRACVIEGRVLINLSYYIIQFSCELVRFRKSHDDDALMCDNVVSYQNEV